jgi:hypothetical protein
MPVKDALGTATHVLHRVHELIFCRVKWPVLRAESAENNTTLAQHQQNRYGDDVYNTMSFTYVHFWFRYNFYMLNALSWII